MDVVPSLFKYMYFSMVCVFFFIQIFLLHIALYSSFNLPLFHEKMTMINLLFFCKMLIFTIFFSCKSSSPRSNR